MVGSRAVAAIVLVMGLFLLPTVGGQAAVPTAFDDTVTTFVNEPVEVLLVAEHEDFDPADPTYTVSFAIVDGPYEGELTGDLSDVVYEATPEPGEPGRAKVRLTYTPRTGYVGMDEFLYVVFDADDNADVATVRVDVVPRPVPPPTLSGWLTLDTTLDSDTVGVASLSSGLRMIYSWSIFRVESISSLSLAGWTTQRFVGTFPLGDALRVRSTLRFNPAGPSFTSWQTDTSYAMVGLMLIHRLHLSGSSGGSYTHLEARGRVENVAFTSRFKFDLPLHDDTGGISFEEWFTTARFAWPACGLNVNSQLRIDKSGFDYVSFTLGDISLAWLLRQSALDLFARTTTTFTAESKEVDLSFVLRSRWVACVRTYVDLVTEDTTFLGVDLFGFEIRCTLPNGVELRSATSFNPDKNSRVTGRSEYFEVLSLTGPVPVCCGSPGRWRIVTYFHDGLGDDAVLFGWGETRLWMDFSLGDDIRLSNGLTVRRDTKDDPVWELSAGIRIRL